MVGHGKIVSDSRFGQDDMGTFFSYGPPRTREGLRDAPP